MVPKVSVIVPVYNCEQYIIECLKSIMNQTYNNIEVVVINDGSTDQSEKMILNVMHADNRIRYINQTNSGPSEARNKGISLSTGKYLVFVDSDDRVNPRYVELLLGKLIESKADLVCCGYVDISKYGVFHVTDFDIKDSISVHPFMELVCKGTGGVLWGKIFRKEIIVKHNIRMDRNIFMSEDLVFVLDYVAKCEKFDAITDYLYHYNRMNQSSISSNISIKYIDNYISVCRHIEKIFNSAKMDVNRTKEIICNRLQNVIMGLIEHQSMNIGSIGINTAVYNIKHVLSLHYIEQYSIYFTTDRYLYKPYLLFIKNKLILATVMYGILVNLLRNWKEKWRIERS